ncbi:hypothetical protein V6N11_082618 [Hibiscus sabdariffa]|uniref:Zinc finger GRF-type domain-containing protein n=1 Tax=Hibiscus sabdariffa TaxID=183260 RepID=A0ABR2P978_9ROSI
MEAKGRRETTRISNWHERMEESSVFPVCGCGFLAQLRTSWSNDNPRRGFFGCKNYDSLVHHGCRYFSWFDSPMTPRAKVVMCLTGSNVDWMKTNGDEDVVAETSVTDDDVAQIADDDDVVGMLFVAFLTCRIYRF